MSRRIKEAFDAVRAEEELKEKTRVFLAESMHGRRRTKRAHYRAAVSAACLLFLFLGGYWLYLMPTAEISIDINPSLELGVNRFDRVVSVNALNEDGQTLAEALDLTFADYSEAVDQILGSEQISSLLSGDAEMVITVIGPEGAQTERILSGVRTCTGNQRNIHCYSAGAEEAEAAREAGLSYGKYRAFLELRTLDPDITPEQVRDMSMRELRELLDSLSGEAGPASGGGAGNPGRGYPYRGGRGTSA